MKRLPIIPVLCYVLLLAAWIVDLLTPQLFVAAVLLNGPIALSGLALNTRLTTTLVVLAEIANTVAGYVNGVQAHYHWDSIAIGDRLLSAASFLLVGYLTSRAQEYALEAGSATERARLATDEKALRRALESVRSTLNVDLVLRAIAREARSLVDANEALLVVRRSQLELPDVYRIERGSRDAQFERRALDPALSSFVQRVAEGGRARVASQEDAVATMVRDACNAKVMASVRISGSEHVALLLLFADRFPEETERLLQSFAEGASAALDQAWLFMQLGYRNEQIAAQNDALEERTRVIQDIVYALAHDLRTPLSAAKVTMQQALDGAYGELPVKYRDVLRTALASNENLRRLVETLLLVARFESGESSTRRESVDLADEARRVAEELRPIAEAKGVHLDTDANHAAILGDPSEIRRALSNLVANAIEATPEGGNVILRVRGDEDEVLVKVEDDGYGVAPEVRDRLFQRFGGDGRALGGGTGLGLYIVRLIVEKLGGKVSYAPREPRGSVFTLTLPAALGPVANV
jgi:signal transduction histidine kinase